MAHKTTSSPDVRGAALWLRRGAPCAVLCVGVGVALAAGTRTPDAPAMTNQNVAAQNVSVQSAAKTGSAMSPRQVARARAQGFEKSEVSDVMVRHVPATASEEKTHAGAGRVYLPAGARRPSAPRTGYGAPVTGMTKVTLPGGGGVSRLVPPSLYPSSRVDTVAGRAVKQCVDPSHHHTTKTVHPTR